MKNHPAFQLYARDLLADLDVKLMDDAAFRVYVELLCYCWEADGLPEETAKLARLTGRSQSDFDAIWSQIGDKFRPASTEDGRDVLYNPRLWQQRVEGLARREKAQTAARASLESPKHPNSKRRSGADLEAGEETVSAVAAPEAAACAPAKASAHKPAKGAAKRSARRTARKSADAASAGAAKGAAAGAACSQPRARLRVAEAEAVEVEDVEALEAGRGCRGKPSGAASPEAAPAAMPAGSDPAPPPADDPPPPAKPFTLPPGVRRGSDWVSAGALTPAAPCAPLGASLAPPRPGTPERPLGQPPTKPSSPRRPHDARELTPGAWGRILDRVTSRLGPDWKPWRHLVRPLWCSSSALAVAVPTDVHRAALLELYGQDLAWAITEAAAGIDLDLDVEIVGPEQFDPTEIAAVDAALAAASTPQEVLAQ